MSSPNESHTEISRESPWTFKQNVARTVWMTLGRVAWAFCPPARAPLVRLFGGKVGKDVRFASQVEVTIPWNVDIGDHVRVRSGAIIYSLGPISIGAGSVLDSRAHLCAGTHDMTDPTFPLVREPIRLGANCYIGIDSYVAPGVTLGDNVRVWPRASVYKSHGSGVALAGNPARPVDMKDVAGREAAAVAAEIAEQARIRTGEPAQETPA